MTAVFLEQQDLVHLKKFVPDLCFDDTERQAALLENDSRDFNAVPGSGKTSLLAAKLLLLAKKWPHSHKGICILSHTNVAREEITFRLTKSKEGTRLLHYPHYIGTIHGFINQFLAMAALRYLGLKIDAIDDDIFAKRASSLVKSHKYSTLRAWLNNQPHATDLVTKLFYKNATLELVSETGKLPGTHTNTYKQMIELKKELAGEGIFRYRDMFAYAKLAITTHPHLLDVVHRRFPMVFIDEMQDTSWEQEDILNQLFDSRSVMQRFGDIDQKIIFEDPDADKTTFPRNGHGKITTSKRFGKQIADVVASVRVSRESVEGVAEDVVAPALLIYKSSNINRVIHRFGELVIDRLSQATLKRGMTRVMCARRGGEGKVDLGRHMSDYWPAFKEAEQLNTKDNLQVIVQFQEATHKQPTLSKRTAEVRRGVLMTLRAAKAPIIDGIQDYRTLLHAVKERHGEAVQLQRLIHELTLSDHDLLPNDNVTLASRMYVHLAALLPQGMTNEEFAALELFARTTEAAERPTKSESPTVCNIVHIDRKLECCLGTIASMKGETHTASLVLESYGGTSRRFDLEIALPFIAGLNKNLDKLPPTQKMQMRNLYVAMSRPTQFLCLAANESRVNGNTIAALKAKGWDIDYIS